MAKLRRACDFVGKIVELTTFSPLSEPGAPPVRDLIDPSEPGYRFFA
jgi:hypothetical protein